MKACKSPEVSKIKTVSGSIRSEAAGHLTQGKDKSPSNQLDVSLLTLGSLQTSTGRIFAKPNADHRQRPMFMHQIF